MVACRQIGARRQSVGGRGGRASVSVGYGYRWDTRDRRIFGGVPDGRASRTGGLPLSLGTQSAAFRRGCLCSDRPSPLSTAERGSGERLVACGTRRSLI